MARTQAETAGRPGAQRPRRGAWARCPVCGAGWQGLAPRRRLAARIARCRGGHSFRVERKHAPGPGRALYVLSRRLADWRG